MQGHPARPAHRRAHLAGSTRCCLGRLRSTTGLRGSTCRPTGTSLQDRGHGALSVPRHQAAHRAKATAALQASWALPHQELRLLCRSTASRWRSTGLQWASRRRGAAMCWRGTHGWWAARLGHAPTMPQPRCTRECHAAQATARLTVWAADVGIGTGAAGGALLPVGAARAAGGQSTQTCGAHGLAGV